MKKILFALVASCALWACKKNESSVTPTSPNYFALAKGNMWVYDYYGYNGAVEELIIKYRDTLRVEKDTVFAGKTCFKITHTAKKSFLDVPVAAFELLCDSAGYLLSPLGRVHASFTSTPQDTIYRYEDNIPSGTGNSYYTYGERFVAKDEGKNIAVPAGDFKVISTEKNFFENGKKKHINYAYYAKGLGLVWEQYSYASSANEGFRKKLIAYKVQ